MCTEEELKDFFEEQEWNSMTSAEKSLFTDFSVTIDIFPPIDFTNVKKEETINEVMDFSSKNIHQNSRPEIFENIDVTTTNNEINETNEDVILKQENTEIPAGDHYLFCESCDDVYEKFCFKCSMLSHVLDNDVRTDIANKAERTLPKDILKIKASPYGKVGVFALKTIPSGIKFGPCEGLEVIQYMNGCAWKLRNDKFVKTNGKQYCNWMQYVNSTMNVSEQNLLIFQYENSLYYRSTKKISRGEELVVYYNADQIKYMDHMKAIYYVPPVEKGDQNVYACTFCCVGFSLEVHLFEHKKICSYVTNNVIPLGEIVQCPFCKIRLDENEYTGFHMMCCCEKHTRKCVLSIPVHRNEKNMKFKRVPKPCAHDKSFKCHCRSALSDKSNHVIRKSFFNDLFNRRIVGDNRKATSGRKRSHYRMMSEDNASKEVEKDHECSCYICTFLQKDTIDENNNGTYRSC